MEDHLQAPGALLRTETLQGQHLSCQGCNGLVCVPHKVTHCCVSPTKSHPSVCAPQSHRLVCAPHKVTHWCVSPTKSHPSVCAPQSHMLKP